MTFDERFPDEITCRRYLLRRRWPKGVRCPRCSNDRVYVLRSRPWHWVCKKCARMPYRFSLYVGTIFENTKYPLRTWFRVLCLMRSREDVSAIEIHRAIGTGSYQTAWYLSHRLRAGLADPKMRRLLNIVSERRRGQETPVRAEDHSFLLSALR